MTGLRSNQMGQRNPKRQAHDDIEEPLGGEEGLA